MLTYRTLTSQQYVDAVVVNSITPTYRSRKC